ncbi:trypsin [Sphingobium sp. SCG-1]|uniref:serine protease n=1 Tax=Sphingobium sp. SCG-1 TaxID=2072936 RepID=UPI000CD694C8|nr:serine protease [Sphingobium sp. SCG-1]AUW58221.1 trypsin [Sphingobium sp. SCG-1]
MSRFVLKSTAAICLFVSSAISYPAYAGWLKNAIPSNVLKKIESTSIKTKSSTEIENVIKGLPENQRNIVRSVFRADPRIIGGFIIDYEKVPWQVALIRGYLPEPNRYAFCGGSLIAADLILTAAHCVKNDIVRGDPKRLAAVAGTGFYGTGGERINVSEIYSHPQYDNQTKENDVAILKLASPSKLGKPVVLSDAMPPFGASALVSGWGVTESGMMSPDLLAVRVPLVSSEACMETQSYQGAIKDSMLCAGERDGGLDSCQGDSGGPLTVGDGAQARLIGVVSWGEGCAQRLKYGVYANVPKLRSWINTFIPVQVAMTVNQK